MKAFVVISIQITIETVWALIEFAKSNAILYEQNNIISVYAFVHSFFVFVFVCYWKSPTPHSSYSQKKKKSQYLLLLWMNEREIYRQREKKRIKRKSSTWYIILIVPFILFQSHGERMTFYMEYNITLLGIDTAAIKKYNKNIYITSLNLFY